MSMIRGEKRISKQVQGLMKRFLASFVFACVLVATGYAGLVRVIHAAAPVRVLMYQGRLLNSNNVPVSDATASMSFALYDSSSGGTCLWSNIHAGCAVTAARTVTLTDGLFSEPLGDTTIASPYAAIPSTIFAGSASVYLEVVVNGETLTPRKQVYSAPFAIDSDMLDGYSTSLVGATSSYVPVADSNGNIVITGSPQGTGVSQGSLYINPATGVVAANEILLGIAVDGSIRLSVDGEGDMVSSGDLEIGGGDFTSTGALRVTSSGGGGLTLNSASSLVNIATSDNFAVGASSLVAPFSVDATNQIIRIGTGATTNATIDLYASNGSTGEIQYDTDDFFDFSGGNFSHEGLGRIPQLANGNSVNFLSSSSITTTSGIDLETLQMSQIAGSLAYSGIEGSGSTAHDVISLNGALTLTGSTSTLTRGVGAKGAVFQTATNNNLLEASGYLSGILGVGAMNASSTTTSDIRGVYGEVFSTSGTISNAYAVIGQLTNAGGTITTSYSLYGKNTAAGSTRYGVYGEASGGSTANYAGYFTGAHVQIDADSTPDSPSFVNGAGDLFLSDTLEVDGNAYLGDTSGTDAVVITSGATTTEIASVLGASLTSGTGLLIRRADDAGAAAFSGKLIDLQMLDTSSAAGVGLSISNAVTGNSIGAHITQTNVANQTDAAGGTSIGGQALLLETPEAGSNDDIMLIRSNGQVVLAIETDGSVLSDNAYSSAGADYAEYFPSTDATLTSYEMVCIDSTRPLSVKRCAAGETDPFGVISSDPGFIGNLPRAGETGNVLVGMVGQIDTQVNANEGAIAIGDPITTSTVSAGYGTKALGPARIVGFALESLSTGTGVIKVLVQPQWYAGNVFTRDGSATKVAGSLAITALTSATSANIAVNSADLQFRGSVWTGGIATARTMTLQTTVTAADEYRLSVKNTDGLEVASVNQSGDLALAGKFYPSDRGAVQGSAYIYFDGSAGIGGSFMRTNASGWATGSYDFAEMFPSPDVLQPGEVVVFGDANEQVKRSTGETYSRTIAGIVSTRPGFLAGENRAGTYPIALAGRVPTFVSTENGEIRIGDPLTTASTPGHAMRATEAGPIVGYASEAFSGTTGTIIVFVNASYYAGTPVEEGPATANTISRLAQDIENFDTVGVLNFNGGQLLAVGSMTSASGTWRLDSGGDIVTSGRLIELVESSTGEKVETYAATSREMTVQLSGTIELNHGRATVRFGDIDPAFTSIVDENPSYRALVTPYGATGSLYVTNRTADGFDIVESGDATSGVDVDWIVVAYRRDYAPMVHHESSTPSSVSQPLVQVMTDGGEVVDPRDEPTDVQVEEIVSIEDGVTILEVPVEEPVAVPESVAPLDVETNAVSEEIVGESVPVEVVEPTDTGDGDSGTSDVGTP